MDFELTEEQRLLRDSVDRLVADHYAFDKRRAYLAEPDGWSRALWAQYAELGLLGLPFAESDGGFGGGPIEVYGLADVTQVVRGTASSKTYRNNAVLVTMKVLDAAGLLVAIDSSDSRE